MTLHNPNRNVKLLSRRACTWMHGDTGCIVSIDHFERHSDAFTAQIQFIDKFVTEKHNPISNSRFQYHSNVQILVCEKFQLRNSCWTSSTAAKIVKRDIFRPTSFANCAKFTFLETSRWIDVTADSVENQSTTQRCHFYKILFCEKFNLSDSLQKVLTIVKISNREELLWSWWRLDWSWWVSLLTLIFWAICKRMVWSDGCRWQNSKFPSLF